MSTKTKNYQTPRSPFSQRLKKPFQFAASAVTIALFAAACGTAEGAAEDGPVVVSGSLSMQPVLEGSLKEELANEDIAVQHQPLLGAEAFTKSLTQRENPEASIVLLQEDLFLKGVQADLWQELDLSKFDNLDELDSVAQPDQLHGQGIGIYGHTLAIAFRKDKFDENGIPYPTSFADLENPQLQGKVGLTSTASVVGPWALTTAARNNGGSATDIDPGFEWFEGLMEAEQVSYVGRSATDINQALQSGEVWAAIHYDQGAMKYMAENEDVGLVYPSDGVPLEVNVAVIPKNAPNSEGAHATIANLISDDTQLTIADTVLTMPVITSLDRPEVTAGDGEVETGRLTVSELRDFIGESAYQIPWEEVGDERDEWHRRWVEEIEPLQ